MEHDRAERLISERLDGQRLPARAETALEEHLAGCAGCRAFERAARRLREAARFEVAPAVPDLVEPIMSAVRARADRPRLRLLPRPPVRPARPWRPRLAPLAAAATVGALIGTVVVGGPWRDADRPPTGAPALAAEDVARGVTGAASGLEGYEARFAITEYHRSPDVPVRELTMQVWFHAPERFRLDVVDHTDYPGPATPTDLRLIVNGEAWYVSAPAPCPSATCPRREISVRNRQPFSSAAPAPTDLVLPLTALGRPEGMEVLGETSALGRPAVLVEVPFERAAPLFPFLSIGGEWRPFFPEDRVRIWLDREDWFPLRWQVFPAAGPEREAWAMRFGLPDEPPRRPIFEVDTLRVETAPPPPGVFEVPSADRARDQGARTVAPAELARRAGFEPFAPPSLGGLELYRAVLPRGDAPESLLTYARGLTYLKVGQTVGWTGREPFGPVDVRAEEVAVGDGVGYYEPASGSHGRRLSIHAAGTDLYLETNLPRGRLLRVAAELPVTGLPMPTSWRIRSSNGAVVERVSPEEAARALAVPLEPPARLPAGYVLASVELVRLEDAVGASLLFRHAEAELGTGALRLYVAPASELPPASAPRQSLVEVDGARGRWTPGRSRLEWLEGGIYRSIDGAGFGLEDLLWIATSIGEAP